MLGQNLAMVTRKRRGARHRGSGWRGRFWAVTLERVRRFVKYGGLKQIFWVLLIGLVVGILIAILGHQF